MRGSDAFLYIKDFPFVNCVYIYIYIFYISISIFCFGWIRMMVNRI